MLPDSKPSVKIGLASEQPTLSTVTSTVVVSSPPLPSLAVYSNVSTPTKPSAGVNWMKSPPESAATTAKPLVGSSGPISTVSESPSGSESLARTSTLTCVLGSVDAVSGSASGSWLEQARLPWTACEPVVVVSMFWIKPLQAAPRMSSDWPGRR